MASDTKRLAVAFLHPDLGLGGAERLVVDAALGLQKLGHSVDIYTSHYDPSHCFEETKDGTLRVHCPRPPFPRSIKGKLHILLAHARQLHLTSHIIRKSASKYDVFFVDQLSTCVPILRLLAGKRVVFYCHFPDKLLADGAYVEGKSGQQGSLLKRLYRMPMDWLEEVTTSQADVIIANSKFTASVFKKHFRSIRVNPRVIYPGVNLSAYESSPDWDDPDVRQVVSDRPTLLSLNRFEKKKNTALAVDSFALFRRRLSEQSSIPMETLRLVIAGGYDPRLEDNMMTLVGLIDRAKAKSLSYTIIQPSSSKVTIPPFNMKPEKPDIILLLNFTTAQRSALLSSASTLALLYTPTNEHFGIGPIEGMVSGLPVLACDSGGPTESIIDSPASERTGWLRPPDENLWADALVEIVSLSKDERALLAGRGRSRAREMFGMDAMALSLEDALREAVALGPVPGVGALTPLLGFLLAFLLGLVLNSLLGRST